MLLQQIVLVGAGSALGGLARWGFGILAGRLFGTGFPWGTFLINISGCLFLGWLSTTLSQRLSQGEGAWLHSHNLHLMIAVGFTGAYTTFSTFEFETNAMLRDGNSLGGWAYLFASVFVGLIAVRLGILLASGAKP